VSDSVLPEKPGFYGWWVLESHLSDAQPAIPLRRPEGAEPPWCLLYVGIAPKGPRSTRTVALRLRKDHRSGNVGGSTFRQSMASLLLAPLELVHKAGHDRSRLVDETALTEWIDVHCGLSIATYERPWELENQVIRALDPPLNLRPGWHPFRQEVDAARRALRKSCGLVR
jgi:hypothetical protein